MAGAILPLRLIISVFAAGLLSASLSCGSLVYSKSRKKIFRGWRRSRSKLKIGEKEKMQIISKDLSGLEEGKTIYKQGKVLVDREKGTFLVFVFNRNLLSGINFWSGEDETLKEDWGFVFSDKVEKAIRFKDDLEEWLFYRHSPLKDEAKWNNVYELFYDKEFNPEGNWEFQTIASIMKKRKISFEQSEGEQ